MSKARLALVTAILAATAMLASTAEAGMKVRLQFGYPLGSFTAHGNSGGYGEHRSKRHRYARSKVKDNVKVTKKSTTTKTVAKAEPEAEIEKVEEAAKTENSSISTAATVPAEEKSAVEPVKERSETKPTKKLDCKKFFPSVGMTLTVPCD